MAVILLPSQAWAMITAITLLGVWPEREQGAHPPRRAVLRRSSSLGSALSVAAFNLGTAVITPIAGSTLDSPLGLDGPATVGTTVLALTLIPTTALALLARRARRSRA